MNTSVTLERNILIVIETLCDQVTFLRQGPCAQSMMKFYRDTERSGLVEKNR